MDNGGNAEAHQTQDQQNQQLSSMNGRGHNGNYSWDFWELGSSRFVDWSNQQQQQQQHNQHNHNNNSSSSSAAAAFMFLNQNNQVNNAHPHLHPHHFLHQQSGLYAGGANMHPDPHLTCLKLGKRHYFEDHGPPAVAAAAALVGDRHVSGFPMMIKRGRSYDDGVLFGGPTSSSSTSSVGGGGCGGGGGGGSSSSTVVIPRCQVEGCHVPLIHAKDYHRRHKVCEMHSKAPKVVVLGAEQRFCQQCSRFHAVSEFDDSKRSCRRRLAGHNERRRKSTSNDSLSKNSSQETSRSMDGRFSYISPSNGRALSLLSSSKSSSSWVSPADISTRSSAALRELIAENRAAAALARQLIFDQNWQQNGMDNSGRTDRSQVGDLSQIPLQHQVFPAEASEWSRFQGSETHVTLDLMQAPSSPFGFLAAGRSKSKEEHEEECCEIWKSLEGTHVV